MNRRQLFTRLSAVALAPLVKLLPKERTVLITDGVSTSTITVPTGYLSPLPSGAYNWTFINSDASANEVRRKFNKGMRVFYSTPQEGA